MNVTDLKTLKCTITPDVRATQLESDKVNDYFAKRISFQNMTAAFFVCIIANRAAQPPRTQGAEYAPSHTSRTRRCERDTPVVQTQHGAYKKCVSQSRHIPLSIRQDR